MRRSDLRRDRSTTDDGGAALRIEGVTVRFGGITALDDVHLVAHTGEIVGIIGPNGAGKTTLFDVVSGVRRPNAGRVVLGGVDVTRRTNLQRARLGVRRTFQRVQTFGWLSVEDNVLAALEWRGGGGGVVGDLVWSPTRRRLERARRQRAEEVLARCGLLPLRSEPAGSLPIGIARMVELARAIVDEPTLLLLDEPASGLDDAEIERLDALLRSIRDETDCVILLVEHRAQFVMDVSDRIVVLDLGRVLAEGSPDDIQRNAAVRDAYLGDEAATVAVRGPSTNQHHTDG